MRHAVLFLALAACGNRDRTSDEGSGTIVASRALADLQLALPEGWTKTYEPSTDAWQLASGDARTAVRIERTDERYVASPDAYMQLVAARWGKDKLVTIEDREQLGRSGFALTLAVFAGEADPQPMRTTHVVRKHGKLWYRCFAEGVDDQALRTQVVALCRSIRL